MTRMRENHSEKGGTGLVYWNEDEGVATIEEAMAKVGALPDEPMSRYTTWRIGGPADWFLEADNFDDLTVARIIAQSRGLGVTMLGNGSNILVADDGVRGLVIKPSGVLAMITDQGGGLLHVGAGVRLPELAKHYRDANAGGLEWGFGVPGCLGGAIFMNAGTPDGEMKDVVERVFIVGPGGRQSELSLEECEFSYRHSRFQRTGEIIVAALIRMPDRPYNTELAKFSLKKRKETQPLDLPNGGSVFRNPPGDYAARLIEVCGLKGHRIGNAQISPQHANFIVNLGKASATEVKALIDLAHETVQEKHGIDLESEVRMIGPWK